MDREGLRRSKTISAPNWWRRKVGALDGSLYKTQKDLAMQVATHAATRAGMERLVLQLGPLPEIDQSTISRCLSGGTSQVLVMMLISEVLRLPPPVYVTRDEIEAERMHSVASSFREQAHAEGSAVRLPAVDAQGPARELESSDRHVGEIEAGADKPSERGHTTVLRKSRGKATKRRS